MTLEDGIAECWTRARALAFSEIKTNIRSLTSLLDKRNLVDLAQGRNSRPHPFQC